MKFKGYHHEASLPFARGARIVIPAGTPVVSTHPQRKQFTTKRRQTVKIHSFGCGMSLCVGWELSNGTRRQGGLTRREDGSRLALIYGTSDPEKLVQHPETVLQRNGDGACSSVFLPVQNPTVVWAGTGGYWCEVDLNLLLEANGVQSHE